MTKHRVYGSLVLSCAKQAARLEYEVAEAEASAVGFKEQLKEAVRRLETSAGEAETARRVAKEAEVHNVESRQDVDCEDNEEMKYQLPFVSSCGGWLM